MNSYDRGEIQIRSERLSLNFFEFLIVLVLPKKILLHYESQINGSFLINCKCFIYACLLHAPRSILNFKRFASVRRRNGLRSFTRRLGVMRVLHFTKTNMHFAIVNGSVVLHYYHRDRGSIPVVTNGH